MPLLAAGAEKHRRRVERDVEREEEREDSRDFKRNDSGENVPCRKQREKRYELQENR